MSTFFVVQPGINPCLCCFPKIQTIVTIFVKTANANLVITKTIGGNPRDWTIYYRGYKLLPLQQNPSQAAQLKFYNQILFLLYLLPSTVFD